MTLIFSLSPTAPSLRRRSLSLSLLSEESVSDPNKIPISLFSVYKRIQNTFAFSLSLRNVLKRQIFFYNLYMWNKLLSLSAFPCWLRAELFSQRTHLLSFSLASRTRRRKSDFAPENSPALCCPDRFLNAGWSYVKGF
jgi:hypothetical protein